MEDAKPAGKAADPGAKPKPQAAPKADPAAAAKPKAKPAADGPGAAAVKTGSNTPEKAKKPPQPAAQKAPQPAAKPAPKPAEKPAPKPAAKPAPQPAAKPAPKPAPQPAAKPAPQPAAKPAPQPAAKPAPENPPITVAPVARAARPRRRHVWLMFSFLLWVLAPIGAAAWYLYTVADDQFASHVGFSVRTEEVGSAVELLGGITELSGSSSSDTDILYEFIQSQQMVRLVHDKLDLAKIYGNPGDPIFDLGEDTRIEALSNYWKRMVKVFYDGGSGLIEIRVLAFAPEDARAITQTVFMESSRMINELSTIARADATRYAEEELTRAVSRLKEARRAKIAFQNRTQIVDPLADLQGRMGLLNSLQQQLAEAVIERQLLLETASDTDPRVQQTIRKIEAIQRLIDEERGRFGSTGSADGGAAYAQLLGEYEELEVEREFAEKAYLSAQAAYDASQAEAQRQSRYLATHIEPTLAETAEYPRRIILLSVLAGALFLAWSIVAMMYYSLRDRR